MRFVAFGDSVMWGQGLRDEDKFVVKASKAIAERAGQAFNRADLTLLAHSGAPIEASREEYEKYLKEFPFRFPTPATRQEFLAVGKVPDDTLDGEVPRAFPTVMDQVRNYQPPTGQGVDVVFISGGGNDLDFEKYIQLRSVSLEADQREIIEKLTDRYRRLIAMVASKFPSALVIAVGYYPILSHGSSVDRIKKMAYDFQDTPQDKRETNEFLYSPDSAPLLTKWFWDAVRSLAEDEGAMDVTAYARRAIQYNLNAYYAAAVIMRQVVRDSALDNVILVEPGLGNDSSLFSSNSHIFEGFLDRLSNDAAKPVRVQAGTALFDQYDRHHQVGAKQLEAVRRQGELIRLAEQISQGQAMGATPESLLKWRADYNRLQAIEDAYVRDEAPRVGFLKERRHMLPIFSFLHPNEKGAAAYFSNIMSKVDLLREPVSIRTHFLRNGGSMRQFINRYGIHRKSVRAIKVDERADIIVLRITARQGFFWGFDQGFINTVKIHLRQPIDGRSYLSVLSLKAQSFASFQYLGTNNPRALDADNNELHGSFPILMGQLDNVIGMEKLTLSNIAAIELEGLQLPNVVDAPMMGLLPNGQAPIVLPDAQMVASRIEVFADTVLVATKTPVPLWKKKNGTNPNVRIDVTA